MIDRPTIERILAAADIVDVVSEFVTLKKAGMNYKGLCPFHDDTTPSFSVSPSRNYCHCFTCGKGGTPVGFIMEHLQMTYAEALRWLAKKYNIEVREREMTDAEREEENEREAMFVVNEWAAKYYHDILYNDVDGRAIGMQYFRSRGFRDDIIEKFRLGFALSDRRAMPREALKKGYKAEYLVKSGLCYSKEGEGKDDGEQLEDRFAGRAIFPWIGLNGKVVAFGGRKLDKATKGVLQKYVNSPESPIYHKANELYGIYQAKRDISKENCVYMVEGYTDVLAMHQCGITNVVANSGTALSQQQIRMLHRFTKNIVLLYDGDAAGQKATERGTDMLLENGMNIKILILPEGEDPDSFSRKNTPEQFKEYIRSHQTDFIQFRIETMMQNTSDPVKRGEMISAIVKSISLVADPITRAAYLQDCATRLNMAEATLTTRMNAFIAEARQEKERRRRIENTRRTGEENASMRNSSMQNASSEGTALQPSATQTSLTPSAQRQAAFPDDNSMPPEYLPDEAFSKPGSTIVGMQGRGLERGKGRYESIERDIVRAVVRYGERIVKNDVETEDGEKVSLTLAEYVFYNLQCDGIELHDTLYTTILGETVERCHDEGFSAIQYFSRHPDYDICRLATEMGCDRYVLSKSLEQKVTEESLLQYIDHLLLALRRDIVDTRLAELLKEILRETGNAEALAPLMKEYENLKEMSRMIAKKLGRNLR